MGDIEYSDDELSNRLNKLEETLRSLNGKPNAERVAIARDCENQHKHIVDRCRKAFLMDTYLLSDGSSREHYMQKLANYDKTLERLKGEIAWAKSGGEKGALFEGKRDLEQGASDGTRDTLLTETEGTQAKTSAAIGRIQKTLGDVDQVADETLNELASGAEKLDQIVETTDKIDNELDIAKKVLASFARRVMTDRLILVFVGLILIGLIVIIVYYSVNPDPNVARVPEVVQPPLPP